MNAILKQSLALAEAKLDENAQTRLAELVGQAIANWSEPAPFTPEEMAHLRVLAEEPFESADPEEVKALFAKARG